VAELVQVIGVSEQRLPTAQPRLMASAFKRPPSRLTNNAGSSVRLKASSDSALGKYLPALPSHRRHRHATRLSVLWFLPPVKCIESHNMTPNMTPPRTRNGGIELNHWSAVSHSATLRS